MIKLPKTVTGPFNSRSTCMKPDRIVSHQMVLLEVCALLQGFIDKSCLEVEDIVIDRDGVLLCRVLPAGGRISGGIRLSGLTHLTLDDFSHCYLVPWLARMVRLKALQADLRALGVEV